jgi:nucleoside-diphosphate-sugar epimerase
MRATPPAFTVLGATGYVGAALVAALERGGHLVHPVTRGTLPALLETRRNAGHVIDCIGITGDFRNRPHDTAEAHVGVTARCLARLEFDSFLFLSSTRVYARAASTHEGSPLACLPADPSDLYNLTKLAGEALCLADPRPTVRVVRVSNIHGGSLPTDTFLGALLQEGRTTGSVVFRQSPRSCKDYVSLADVTHLLPLIAVYGRHRLYNLASGVNTSHAAIALLLRRHAGWRVSFAPNAPAVRFPPIDIGRLATEFGRPLSNSSEQIARLVGDGQEIQCSPSMSPVAG